MRVGVFGRLRERSRVVWALADQAAYSGSNFLLAIVAIRLLPSNAVGVVAIATSMMGLSLVLARGLSETFFVDEPSREAKPPILPILMLLIGLMASGLTCLTLIALVHVGMFGPEALRLALHMLPGIMAATLYEVVRQLRFSLLEVKRVLVADLLWFCLLGLALTIGVEQNVALYWSIGAGVALMVAFPFSRLSVTIGQVFVWRHGAAVAVDQASHRLAIAGALTLLGLSGHAGVAGGISAARTLLGPANWVILSVSSVGIAEFAQSRHAGRARQVLGPYALLAAGVPLGLAAVALALPASVAGLVGDETSALLRTAIVWVAIGVVAEGMAATAAVRIRTRGAMWQYVPRRLATVAVLAVAPVAATVIGDVAGYVALAGGQVLHACAMILPPSVDNDGADDRSGASLRGRIS